LAEVAHITRDSDTTLKVKSSRSPGRFTHRGRLHIRQLQRWAWESIYRGNLLLRCSLQARRRLGGASAPRGRKEAGHIVAAARPTVCYGIMCNMLTVQLSNSLHCGTAVQCVISVWLIGCFPSRSYMQNAQGETGRRTGTSHCRLKILQQA